MKGFGTMGAAVVSPRLLESVTPEDAGQGALTDPLAETRTSSDWEPVIIRPRGPVTPTTALPPIGFKVPQSFKEVMSGGGSAAGFSAVSSYLTCPEQSRLRSLGVRRRVDPSIFREKLEALTFGIIAHAIRAMRLIYGHELALRWFWTICAPEIPRPDADKLDLMFRIYDSIWPLYSDPFKLLGVEVEVVTDIAPYVGPRLLTGGPILRTVRYDTVIAHPDGGVYSFEAKTAARTSNLEQYNAQGAIQCGVWNANSWLVAQYGQMRGVIFDEYVKTEVPKCDRKEPKYFSIAQQQLALRYLAVSDLVKYPVDEYGRFPQFLHSCWGKYSPCTYIPLCHEDAAGLYEYADGTDYVGG